MEENKMKDFMRKLMMADEMSEEDSMMDDQAVQAKMDMIDELRNMMRERGADSIMDGMQSVKVASPTKEGLQEGLEMAEEKLEEMPEESMMEAYRDEDEEEDEEEEY
jgi:hypothetical protein